MKYTKAQIDDFSEFSWELSRINNTTDIFNHNQKAVNKIQDLLISAIHDDEEEASEE